MVQDFRNKEDYGRYEYWKREAIAGKLDTPIRRVFDKQGREASADTIDPATGKLIRALGLLNDIDKDNYVDEITEEGFYALCEQHILDYQKKTAHEPQNGLA